MFGLAAFVPVSQSQSTGLPWYVWLLLLVIVIVVVILLQRRSDAKKAPPAQVEAPAPVRAVEAPPVPEVAAAGVAAGAEAVEAVAPVAGAPVAREAVAEAPAAGVAAAVGGVKPPARPWKSSAWRTREWQPEPPTWYPKWKHRRPAK